MAFQLDIAGGAEVLKELAAEQIAELAQLVASAAGDTAEVKLSTTDRARASVRVPADAQAKDGILSRAAAEVGLEIHPSKKRPPRTRTAKRTESKGRKARKPKNSK